MYKHLRPLKCLIKAFRGTVLIKVSDNEPANILLLESAGYTRHSLFSVPIFWPTRKSNTLVRNKKSPSNRVDHKEIQYICANRERKGDSITRIVSEFDT
jgi:hypothetical protein